MTCCGRHIRWHVVCIYYMPAMIEIVGGVKAEPVVQMMTWLSFVICFATNTQLKVLSNIPPSYILEGGWVGV